MGGLQSIAKANETLTEKGPKRMSPFFIPSCLINLASGQISIKHGLKVKSLCSYSLFNWSTCNRRYYRIIKSGKLILW